MKIGIDLDNTIISYDRSFALVGKKLGLIPDEFSGTKSDVREFLRKSENGEENWQRLQGQVYGRYISTAEIYTGVYRFLWRCKKKGIPVDIVSHKTEFGHYDEEKVSLRQSAIEFLSQNGLYLADQISFIQNIFFHDTKEEKVEKIKEENYSWFIDDLEEILTHPFLEKIEQKIYFDPNQIHPSFEKKNIYQFTSWGEIENYILGKYQNEDLNFFKIEFNLSDLKNAYWCEGQGNSRIAFIETDDNKKYALKLYPADFFHNRLNSEFYGFKILHKNLIKNVPVPIYCNSQINCALYEWVDGIKINSPTNLELDAMLDMMKKLNELAKSGLYDDIQKASASCFSISDIENQINTRLKLLYPVTNSYKDLSKFLEEDLIPFKNFLIKWVKKNLDKENNFDLPISKKYLTLSPSDFGFHNMLRKQNGDFVFLDFEYFGWDDPIKLIVDVSIHPAMNLNEKEKDYWKKGMFSIFGESLERRYEITWAIYSLCWCLILLNEFRTDIWVRRVFASEDKENYKGEILGIQLNKSISLLKSIQEKFYKQNEKG